MEQDKINQLMAAKTTVAYCEDTAAETASNTAFAPKVAVIKGKIVVVEGFIQLSETPIGGVTINVKTIRAVAIENVLPLASALFAFSNMQTPPDPILMVESKITKTYLEDLSKEDCFNECQRIVTLANDHAADILPLGITALMLTDAGASVTLFGNVITSPRAAIVSRKSAGEQAENTLASIMNVDLKLQLDPMADIFRFTKNVWWKAYKDSREVIDLGTTRTKFRASLTSQSNAPVAGADVSLSAGGFILYTEQSEADGKVSISPVKPGTYDLKIEKPGFLAYTQSDIHLSSGDEEIHHITLLPGTGPAGQTIVSEGDIPPGAIYNFDTSQLNASPDSSVRVEITGGEMNIYAAVLMDENPGTIFWHLTDPTNTLVPLVEFAQLIGVSDTRKKVTFNNPGGTPTHYKLTFYNV